MVEAQVPGVQHLARRPIGSRLVGIDGVSQERMAQGGHVHPDLVGPPGEDTDPKQGGAAVTGRPEHPVPGLGLASAPLDHGHARLDDGVAPQRKVDGAFGSGHPGHQGQVFLVHETRGKGLCQVQPGRVGQRQNDDPGCILVQPVHHAGTLARLGQ